MKIHQDIDSNLVYLMKCQTEKMEDIGTEIIADAEATVNTIIRQAGLESIQEENKRLKNRKLKQIKKV